MDTGTVADELHYTLVGMEMSAVDQPVDEVKALLYGFWAAVNSVSCALALDDEGFDRAAFEKHVRCFREEYPVNPDNEEEA